MTPIPEEILAEAKRIKKVAKSPRRKTVIDGLIGRGVAPERIEQTIRDAEAAAEAIAQKAKARIAHRKRAKLKIVKS